MHEFFRNGDQGQRRAALRVMADTPELWKADDLVGDVLNVIDHSESGDEQYRALDVMHANIDRLKNGQKSTLLHVLETWQRHPWIVNDPPRSFLVNEMLRKLGETQPG